MSDKLSSAIRNYRENNNLTQNELAPQIGISSIHLGLIENGHFEKASKKALLSAIDFVLGLDTTTINEDIEIAALQDYRAAKILRAIQNGEVPGALLGRMISILERGYD